MATLPNALPRLAALGLPLPPGRLVDATADGPWHEPLLWLADEPAKPGAWSALAPALRTAGLLPVLIEADGPHGGPDTWDLMPGAMSYPGDHDPDEVLAELWEEYAAGESGEDWPGRAESAPEDLAGLPDTTAADIADSLLAAGSLLREPRLALVPARRSADVPAVIGWGGPANHEGDTARLCAVLRSWEDRFGIRVVALGFDHLLVSVASPSATPAQAEAIAAEHFAFCPDNILQSGDDVRAYAETRLLGQPAWHFWWD
ncbi:hypothetical protein SZN_01449 [Streptomyces zinciresistens K42]|uniref:DUF4253 domain-containing protein n=1 Tax=Streptomyces zinciresistens K42 TaxID=700597 RepID=G2G488_9ACTN|nr:DUF4253 domain-containing protein [Streptomyces zinciresistens]EGX61563.1 hypothetical protein SZN_01449 [Streptomyces zinciresistens K42]